MNGKHLRYAPQRKWPLFLADSFASYFPSAFVLFSSWTYVGNEMRSSQLGTDSSLIYILCFGVFSFTGPFGHRDVSEPLGASISLKLTLLFFLPSDSPCQLFGLRADCLETATAFGRSA